MPRLPHSARTAVNTGDQVTLLADGSIRFAERVKDMLKIGGENVASLEIERVLKGIDDVEELAVIVCHHPMLDEIPVAFGRVGGSAIGRRRGHRGHEGHRIPQEAVGGL